MVETKELSKTNRALSIGETPIEAGIPEQIELANF